MLKILMKHFIVSKTFIEYSNDMNNIYKSLEGYNLNKKHKMLNVFDDMIADIFSNKKLIQQSLNYLLEVEN